MRRIGLGLLVASALAASATALAAPDKGGAAPSTAPSPSATAPLARVTPAAERAIEGAPPPKPKGTDKSFGKSGPGTKPALKGPKVPDALREKMRGQVEARIEKDVREIKALRKEAIQLLTAFIAETPRESREMPEAMMRLGELRWELEREEFVERFRAWEAKPVDQRGPTPEPNFVPARELFGRVLKDYPWFAQYDLALYVDGFLATEQGKNDEALERFKRILKDFPA